MSENRRTPRIEEYMGPALGILLVAVGVFGVPTTINLINQPQRSGAELSDYARKRLDNSTESDGTDIVLSRAVVRGTNKFTREALESVGGVRAHTEPSTTSAVVGLTPEGAVFNEVVLINNWIGAKCDLPIKIEYDLLPRGEKGEAIVPEVCWMSADYFPGRNIPQR